jgi:hypothetical protein
MGAELSIPTKILVRLPSATDGAVTLIQRFGGALNLNVHFHILFLDGVYTTTPWGKSRFHRTNAPERQEMTELVHRISHWVVWWASV